MPARTPARRHALFAVVTVCCGVALVAAATSHTPPQRQVVAAEVGSVAQVQESATRWVGVQAAGRTVAEVVEPTAAEGLTPRGVEPPQDTPAAATPAPAQEAAAASQSQPPGNPWEALADCESGRWSSGTPMPGSARWDYGVRPSHDGFFEGGLGFHPQTWEAYRDAGMPGHAGQATPAQQIVVGERVQAAQGWGAWPVCSRKVGLR